MRMSPGVHNRQVTRNFTLFRMFTWLVISDHVLYIRQSLCGGSTRAARSGPSAALVPDGLGGRYRCLRVQVAPARRHGAERRIKLVQQRDASGDVELGNRRVADPVQVLDQGPQRV